MTKKQKAFLKDLCVVLKKHDTSILACERQSYPKLFAFIWGQKSVDFDDEINAEIIEEILEKEIK